MGAPYRIAAPPPPDPPDAFDAYEVELRARLRRGRYLTVLGFTVVAGAWFALAGRSGTAEGSTRQHEITRRAREEAARREGDLRSVLGRERTETLERQEVFRRALADAFARDVTPDAAAAPCAAQLLAGARAQDRLVGGATVPLVVVDVGDQAIPSPSLEARLASIDYAERLLESGRWPDARTIARALDRRPMGAEVVVVATVHRLPVSQTGISFEPGMVRGKAYVYDFGERHVTCAGAVESTSSPTIEYAYVEDPSTLAAADQAPRLRASLEADLERQLRRAAQASLRTIP